MREPIDPVVVFVCYPHGAENCPDCARLDKCARRNPARAMPDGSFLLPREVSEYLLTGKEPEGLNDA